MKSQQLTRTLFILIFGLMLGSRAAAQAKHIAVLIGPESFVKYRLRFNQTHQGPNPRDLSSTSTDLKMLRRALKHLGWQNDQDIHILQGPDANRFHIQRCFDKLSVTPGTFLFIGISSHGTRVNGNPAILAYDYPIEEKELAGTVQRLIEKKVRVFWLVDACYGASIVKSVFGNPLVKYVSFPSERSSEKSVVAADPLSGEAIIAASAKDQPAFETQLGNTTTFASALSLSFYRATLFNGVPSYLALYDRMKLCLPKMKPIPISADGTMQDPLIKVKDPSRPLLDAQSKQPYSLVATVKNSQITLNEGLCAGITVHDAVKIWDPTHHTLVGTGTIMSSSSFQSQAILTSKTKLHSGVYTAITAAQYAPIPKVNIVFHNEGKGNGQNFLNALTKQADLVSVAGTKGYSTPDAVITLHNSRGLSATIRLRAGVEFTISGSDYAQLAMKLKPALKAGQLYSTLRQLSRPTPTFTLHLSTDSPTYRLKEGVTIQLEADRKCYVYLFSIGVGQMTVLLPNKFQDEELGANTVLELPSDKTLYRLTASAPTGPNILIAIASTQRLENVPGLRSDQIFSEISDPSLLAKAINSGIKGIDVEAGGEPAEWAVSSTVFKIIP